MWAHNPSVYLSAIWYFKVRKDVNADVAATPVRRKGEEPTLFVLHVSHTPTHHPEEREREDGGSYPFKRQSKRHRLTALP